MGCRDKTPYSVQVWTHCGMMTAVVWKRRKDQIANGKQRASKCVQSLASRISSKDSNCIHPLAFHESPPLINTICQEPHPRDQTSTPSNVRGPTKIFSEYSSHCASGLGWRRRV